MPLRDRDCNRAGVVRDRGVEPPLVLLTTVICFLAMIASWGITKFVKGYCMLFLLLETGMIGVFLSLDCIETADASWNAPLATA